MNSKPRLAVLASGTGSNLRALIEAVESGQLEAEIALVVSNRRSGALEVASRAGIEGLYLPLADTKDSQLRHRYTDELTRLLKARNIDLVIMAGWMLVLTEEIFEAFPNRVINLHPALLPDGPEDWVISSSGHRLPALRGAKAVQMALELGLPVTGSTVHYATPKVDCGPVIDRVEVPIRPGDTPETLHGRIKEAEHRMLPVAVAKALKHLKASSTTAGNGNSYNVQS
jgi:phosphoribosylglycinamide formyltransferase-1